MSAVSLNVAKLSAEQWEIVHHPVDEHAVVLAVAGSGKSTTLIERMAYLHEFYRVKPQEIIAVMFNRSAALEMNDKLVARMGRRNTPLSVTYHRLGTLTLKALVDAKIVLPWKFDASPVAATKFAISAISEYLTQYKYPRFVAEAFLGFVDRVKSDLADPYQVFEDGDWPASQEWFPMAYDVYEKARHKAGLRFFSDLIYDPVMAVRNCEKAAAAVADKFAHIIVDEYQDICESQQALIRAVAGQRARVMVVGDDDQTIYTWRGANPAYILRDFEKDFVGAKVYKLSNTWRYGHNLSCAANYLIFNNKDRANKLCVSGVSTNKTHLRLVQGDPESVIRSLRPLLKSGVVTLGEVAILVRTYSQSGKAQLELLSHGIPFRLEGGEKVAVLENQWVKMLIGWMGVGAGDIAARPYAGEPDYGSVMQLKEVLSNRWLKLDWESHNKLCSTVLSKPSSEGFSMYSNNFVDSAKKQTKDSIRSMAIFWQNVKGMGGLKGVKPFDFLSQVVAYFDFENKINQAHDRPDDAETQIMLVKSFLDYARQFKGGCVSFLDHIADLRSFSDAAKASVEAVHITSIHRSKGLEWSAVFMLGLVQGKFPAAAKKKENGLKVAARLEDERRLFYVGMTRARNFLYFIAPLDNDVEADAEAALDTTKDYVPPKVDGRLMTRLNAGISQAPFSLLDTADDAEVGLIKNKKDKENTDGGEGYPSQFLYEANIIHSGKVSDFLNKGEPSIKSVSPELLNVYLGSVGSKKRAGKIRLE